MSAAVIERLKWADQTIVEYFQRSSFTENLVASPVSTKITEFLLLAFLVVLLYECMYWSGIYLGLWQYRAQDIFTEIPVHCAHVYVRLRVIKKDNLSNLLNDYAAINHSVISRNWYRYIRAPSTNAVAEAPGPVTYHFEFSPDDFEMNDEPEWGSTVLHLRSKLLQTFTTSPLASKIVKVIELTPVSVILFNHHFGLVKQPESDDQFLCKVDIETGEVIDASIVLL